MKTSIKINLILALLLFYFMPSVTFAAKVSVESDNTIFKPQEEFLVKVYVDTEETTVNAVEGSIIFPKDLLELREIRDGNSIINFWVEKPKEASEGKITFSGITTGGFSGSKMYLFAVVFKSRALGSGTIDFKDMQILLNDGKGTNAPVFITPLNFSATEAGSGKSPADLSLNDTDPPEEFVPFIASDPSIYDGKYFLVFSTVDKGSGLDHFEIREGIWSDYVPAESPYLLKDQSLGKDILVKAVDKAGNKTIVKVKAQNPAFTLKELLILGIILLVCFFALKKIWQTFNRK